MIGYLKCTKLSISYWIVQLSYYVNSLCFKGHCNFNGFCFFRFNEYIYIFCEEKKFKALFIFVKHPYLYNI